MIRSCIGLLVLRGSSKLRDSRAEPFDTQPSPEEGKGECDHSVPAMKVRTVGLTMDGGLDFSEETFIGPRVELKLGKGEFVVWRFRRPGEIEIPRILRRLCLWTVACGAQPSNGMKANRAKLSRLRSPWEECRFRVHSSVRLLMAIEDAREKAMYATAPVAFFSGRGRKGKVERL
ncbi:predicted protein [Coccidioides posadasii str. Silveira]|uniref:Predicted protein n=2 Tax=Coccidioides posadasii TaxID=199306 RepID=E9CTF8_COCPS|nr:predicted protein [Coccidioides posadasii str. Silveira]KMM67260.1 hypothetical protein CPAG_03595 [Coccidioides posadasii RMSCC 3488]